MATTIVAGGAAVTVTADYEAVEAFRESGMREYATYETVDGRRATIARAAIAAVIEEATTTTRAAVGFR